VGYLSVKYGHCLCDPASRYQTSYLIGVSRLYDEGVRFKLTRDSGMNVAAGPELAAAVSNAGGLGVIGGLGYT